MSFCGERTLYVTSPAPLHLAPFKTVSAAAINTTPAVSVVVSTYRLRICYVSAKHRSPLDVPLAAIESVQQHRGSDGAWVAVKCKTTCAFRLILYNTTGESEEGVNILAGLMQTIEVTIPKSMCDFFAFAYFAALKKVCVAKAHEAGLQMCSQSNSKVTEICNGIPSEEHGIDKDNTLFLLSSADRVKNTVSHENGRDTCTGEMELGSQFTTNSELKKGNKENNDSTDLESSMAAAVKPCEVKEVKKEGEEGGEDVIFSMVKEIPVLNTVKSLTDMNEAFSFTLLGEKEMLQMRRSASAVICESPVVSITSPTNNMEKKEKEVSSIHTEKLELPSPLRTRNEFNIPEIRYSIIDGDFEYDSAWYAYNIEEDFYRMTRLTHMCNEILKTDNDNDNETNLIPNIGPGIDVSPWFHIIPLSRGDLFATYPFSIVVPRRVTVELAERVSLYRHNGRIPSISWIHLETGASISRAAQPGSGSYMSSDADALFCSFLNPSFQYSKEKKTLQKEFHSTITEEVEQEKKRLLSSELEEKNPLSNNNNNNNSDVWVPPPLLFSSDENVNDLQSVTSERGRLVFFDCRSRAAAAANFPTGGGFEIVRNYDHADIQFLNLENIHAVRAAFSKLGKLCMTLQRHECECNMGTEKHPGSFFFSKLDATGWPEMITKIIWSSWVVTEKVVAGDSVLVHCTDGWDRTTQVVSLAMLQLDGYYRTIEGFCVLIMREWLEMGHRFADRCANNRSGEDAVSLDAAGEDDNPNAMEEATKGRARTLGITAAKNFVIGENKGTQISPIFVQFIDAVYQLVRLFPSDFEFTPKFLQYLLDEVYSCRFGTFLYNCHRIRYRRGGITHRTASLWGEVEALVRFERENPFSVPAHEKLVNPFYIPLDAYKGEILIKANEPQRSKYLIRRLVPSGLSPRYVFWHSYYCRYNFTNVTSGVGFVGLEPDNLVPLMDSWLWYSQKQNIDITTKDKTREKKSESDDSLRSMFLNRIPVVNHVARESPGSSSTTTTTTTTTTTCVDKQMESLNNNNNAHTVLSIQPNVGTASIIKVTSCKDVIDSVSDGSCGDGESTSLHVAPTPLSMNLSSLPSTICLSSNSGVIHRLGNENFIPRSKATSCEVCAKPFTFFFRRHACRHCGRAVCTQCGGRFLRLPSLLISLYEDREATRPVRICSICYSKVVSHAIRGCERQL
ncbi:zinc-binding phosphatase [Trypanosoma theileri]|uniref:phosphatidylinositol-3,5-bisphosphate 3-phosphatase n=1 Tax=Trypanosoma theileri TaxID=67003 RepID=A0A1X0P9S9_9TRYP|nr:zinc-binding phosphatase [Trypanosoma theileri]ORC93349.1 zinc-binding phosphatase [Trypanosoma theileri]